MNGGHTGRERQPQHLQRAVLWCCVFLAVSVMVGVGGLSASSGQEKQAGIGSQVRGTAYRPYIYRQLVPLCERAVLAVLPGEKVQRLDEWLANSGFVHRLQRSTKSDYSWLITDDLGAIFLGIVINILSLFLFIYALRAVLRDLFVASDAFFNIAPAVAAYLTVFMNREGVYSYDYPQILLFTLGLLLTARGSWKTFYPVFVLTTINKETSLLLSIVFAIVYWRRMPLRSLAAHLVAQIGLFSATIFVIHRVFASSPGDATEWHLFDHNLRLLLNPDDDYGALAAGLMIIALLFRDWKDKPEFLRKAAVIFWPLSFLTLLFGWVDELRDYYEFYVIAAPLMAMTVARHVFGLDVASRVRNQDNHATASPP